MASTRRLAAILAADVAGYSRLMGTDEEGTHERVQALLRELINPMIAEHRGRVVKTTGDGFLAEFPSIVDAVRCAVEIQRAMVDREPEVPDEQRMRFRIGVNLGDVIAEEDDIFGDGVNIAARLEGLAEPGGVLVSNTAYDHVRDRLPFAFEDMGERQVRNIARPVRVYRVLEDPDATVRQPALASIQPLPDKPSLAVLPFQNMTGDVEQDYFVDGVVEEITTAIACLPWLFVIARNSSFTYKGRAVDVKQVARELGVRYVLEGSVRKSGSRVRITGQLIDTKTGAHIWAKRFDEALDDIFVLQDQVASSVAGAIEPELRLTEIERANREASQRLDTYDLHLRALGQFHIYTAEGIHNAIALLKRALEIDPSYAPAAGLICESRIVLLAQAWDPVSAEERAESVSLARQIIQSPKNDPDALWMAAMSLSIFGHDHDAAARAVERALSANPNSAQAWEAKGWICCYQNQPYLAIEAFERAMRLSPLDPLRGYFAGGLALAKLATGKYEEAVDWSERALHEFPRYVTAIRTKIAACAHLDRIAEARDGLERLFQLQPVSTVQRWVKTAQYPPEILSVFQQGLRKAGMPEE
jgi:adenylate cyclase